MFLSWILLSHCPQAQLRPTHHLPHPKKPHPPLSLSGVHAFLGGKSVGHRGLMCVCVYGKVLLLLQAVFVHTHVHFISTWGVCPHPPRDRSRGCWGSQSEQITSPLMGTGQSSIEWQASVKYKDIDLKKNGTSNNNKSNRFHVHTNSVMPSSPAGWTTATVVSKKRPFHHIQNSAAKGKYLCI